MSALVLIKAVKVVWEKSQLTKRALDGWDSAPFSSSFHALAFFLAGRRPAARPSAGNANRWAVTFKAKL